MPLHATRRYYDNEALSRLEAIFERTCIDLQVDDQSPYARSTRETLARLLFTMPVPDKGLIQPTAARFAELARSYGQEQLGACLARNVFE